MHRLWLVSYDIACDRRRRKVDKLLSRWGDRVLESLYECRWRADQVPGMVEALRRCMKVGDDHLALLPLCRDCQRQVRTVGDGCHACTGEQAWFVV